MSAADCNKRETLVSSGPAAATLLAGALGLFRAESAAAAPAAAAAGSALPAGGIAQALIGLAAVLALVAVMAWALKRFSGLRGTGSGLIRIVGAAAVGPRERIVLVEVGGSWLLVGVAPGQVRALHTLPKADSSSVPAPPAEAGFAGWLQRVSERRNHA